MSQCRVSAELASGSAPKRNRKAPDAFAGGSQREAAACHEIEFFCGLLISNTRLEGRAGERIAAARKALVTSEARRGKLLRADQIPAQESLQRISRRIERSE